MKEATPEFAVLILKGAIEVFVEREENVSRSRRYAPEQSWASWPSCAASRGQRQRAKEDSTVLKWSDEALHTAAARDRSLAQNLS